MLERTATSTGDGTGLKPDEPARARVFISYSRKDIAFADQLDSALEGRGFEPLIDRSDIYAFEEWWKRIEALIARADTVVFVLSTDAVRPDSVARKEVDFAASLNKRFAPVVYRRVDDKQVPETLAKLNFIFFDDTTRFEQSADQLSNALKTDIGWVRQHTDLKARRWAAASEPSGLLLRSPVLEQAERWIASRSSEAPAPTEETQRFIRRSRQGATRRRNILTGSLAAGLVLAVGLAGLAYWQRGVAVQQTRIAEERQQFAEKQTQIAEERQLFAEQQQVIAVEQRNRAERTLSAATQTANSLVFDLAQRFRVTVGVPAGVIKDILERARALQEQLSKSGEASSDLKRSEAVALIEISRSLLAIGDTNGALSTAQQGRQVLADLVEKNPDSTNYKHALSVAYYRLGEVRAEQGDVVGALNFLRDDLVLIDQLAKSDPSNEEWQRDLGATLQKIGDVQVSQGDLARATVVSREPRDLRAPIKIWSTQCQVAA